jgi:hypothetical protein
LRNWIISYANEEENQIVLDYEVEKDILEMLEMSKSNRVVFMAGPLPKQSYPVDRREVLNSVEPKIVSTELQYPKLKFAICQEHKALEYRITPK